MGQLFGAGNVFADDGDLLVKQSYLLKANVNYHTGFIKVAGAPAFLGQIQLARRRGYNLRDVGLVQGTKSLSAWIRTPDGEPAAAITLSAIRSRLSPRRAIEVADVLVATARAIEAATPRD